MSSHAKNGLPTSFKTTTYSRIEAGKAQAGSPEIKSLNLPNLSQNGAGSGRKGNISLPEKSFRTTTYPHFEKDSVESGNRLEQEALLLKKREIIENYHNQAVAEKEELLRLAREDACAVLADAQTEARLAQDEIRRQAHEEGLAAADAEIKKRLADFDELLQRLDAIERQCRQQHEEAMVGLALDCARKLVGRELSLDETIITSCVEEVFKESSVQGRVTLFLNREDFALINQEKGRLLAAAPRIHELKIEIGEGLEKGGCILESPTGRIDASIRGKFEELQRLLGR
ncbi:MAG: hypothetical protein JXR89_11820 [Deltaproteobacteria bacterium]|nr:hypothetical protein [Deltaproteobacteria bacterium]